MSYQSVFRRYELKYILTAEQRQRVMSAIEPYTVSDKYSRATVRNIYFDTESYRLIRRSLEKPEYKEKLRVRSYAAALPDSTVFVELKKKYKGVVYKRREALSEADAMDWLLGKSPPPVRTQITEEIDYFMRLYGTLRPSVYLSYEREAYCWREDRAVRITFDSNILSRESELSLREAPYGEPVLPGGLFLMEIKCSAGMPLALVDILSRERIYKTSFSKYGRAYADQIFPRISGCGNNIIKEKFINA